MEDDLTMGITNVNEQGSAYGAAFRNKPVYFMTGKETEAFLTGRCAGTWSCGRIPAPSAAITLTAGSIPLMRFPIRTKAAHFWI